jgi:HAD superfamily hydrolase (TIGR01450 family)
LEHQLAAFDAAGVEEVLVLTGYRSEQIRSHCRDVTRPRITLIENTEFEFTNNMYSLYLAAPHVEGQPFVLSNGDVVFDPEIISEIIESERSDLIGCDRGSHAEESMKVTIDSSGRITDIAKTIGKEDAFGNSIDLYRFSEASSTRLFAHIRATVEDEGNRHDWTEVAIRDLLHSQELVMQPHDIRGRSWAEIDDGRDLLNAEGLFAATPPTLTDIELVLLDLDGTLYLGDRPIEGATEFVARLRDRGIPHYFLSNNSSRAPADYVARLQAMGIHAEVDQVILSTNGLVAYLKAHGVEEVYAVGTEAMRQVLTDAGIRCDAESPRYVALGYDTSLTYAKLRRAALHLQSGADLLATHRDLVCPTPEGPIPDIGSMLALLETATGKKPLEVFGKPDPGMTEAVRSRHGVASDRIAMVGDRLYTDGEMARRIGSRFVLVLSGETNRADIEDIEDWPDLIVGSVADLLPTQR